MSAELLIEELEKRWHWPPRMEPEVKDARLSDIIADFAVIAVSEVHETIAVLRKSHTKDWMPNTATIQAALDRVRKTSAGPARPSQTAAEAWMAGERVALSILSGKPIAQEAWDEGWFGDLLSFCTRQRRLPNDAEARRLQREAAEREAEIAAVTIGGAMRDFETSVKARLEQRALSVGVAISVEA
jgi:hypothetical protein